jgi:hypothetical protein
MDHYAEGLGHYVEGDLADEGEERLTTKQLSVSQ